VDHIRALPQVISLRFEESQAGPDRHGESGNRRNGDRTAAELFSDYYKTKRKADPEPELVALFARLYQEASTADDEN
jgi:hypothetical protein